MPRPGYRSATAGKRSCRRDLRDALQVHSQNHIERWDEEEIQKGRQQHAAHNRGAHGAATQSNRLLSAKQRGRMPRMNANEVIRMGRRRSSAASIAA